MRIGVVGAGYLGTIHSRLLSQNKDVEWTYVFDMDGEKAQSVAEQFGGLAARSLDQVIEASDAVLVVSATSSHHAVAKQALEAGKHVFLEKPITTTVAEGEELVRLARANNLKLQVGHVERFNRAFRALGSEYPHPKFIEAHRLAQFKPRGTDVAVVLDLMIHDLDLILKLMGEFPSQIDASGVAVISEAADIANARLSFPSGGVANVTASRISANPMRKLRMFSEDSYISLDFAKGDVQQFRLAHHDEENQPGTLMLGEIEKGAVKRKILMGAPSAPEGNAIDMEQKTFFDAILNNTEPPVTGEDGLNALKVAVQILEKIGTTETATGRE
ncbi:MAG: Gfo/Idh/MocA family oxidoreductase [Calditrichaeota bacterium]|nr:Gfo/Idh/MocA family oxidoreductase [Calditrichota bacterium]